MAVVLAGFLGAVAIGHAQVQNISINLTLYNQTDADSHDPCEHQNVISRN
jgi:hypothetical protein